MAPIAVHRGAESASKNEEIIISWVNMAVYGGTSVSHFERIAEQLKMTGAEIINSK